MRCKDRKESLWLLVLCLLMMCMAAGCGGADSGSAGVVDDGSSTDSGTAFSQQSATDQTAQTVTPEDWTGDSHSTPGVDEDLTKLSGTMVYAAISDIVYNPDNYKGKVIRLNGLFATYQDEGTGKMYFACVNQDATACCAQGIEFILPEDEYTYPEDYPAEGDMIIVQGTFDTYVEGEYIYPTLRDASLIEPNDAEND